jgi:hypothetical protein
VSQAGEVLDSTGLDICPGECLPTVAVGFDGTNYLVVWHQSLGDSVAILATRVSPSGALLDTPAFRIAADTGDRRCPATAFDGLNYLVTWFDCRRDSADIYAARVTPSGVVLDPGGFAVSTRPGGQFIPDVAFDGANYLVVWQDRVDVLGARVTPGGTVLDTNGVAICKAIGSQVAPRVDFDGSHYLVVWADWTGDKFIAAARVTPAGAVLDTIPLMVSPPGGYAAEPVAGFDGTHHLLLWTALNPDNTGTHIRGVRLRPDGTRPDSMDVILGCQASDQWCPQAAFDGTNYLVAWNDARCRSGTTVRAARITPTGIALDPTGLAVSAEDTYAWVSGLAFGGTNYLVVWEQNERAYAARVSPVGTVLDPGGFAVSADPSPQHLPRVSFDGINFLVVWATPVPPYHAHGARVSQDGSILDTQAIFIGPSSRGFNLASGFDGANHLVVWCGPEVRVVQVTPAGVVLDTSGIRVSSSPQVKWYPSVSCGTENSLVAWYNEGGGIAGARVSPAGVVLDTLELIIEPQLHNDAFTSAVSDGADHIVAWANDTDVAAARLLVSGEIHDRFSRAAAQSYRCKPSAALAHGLGSQVLLTFQEFALRPCGRWFVADRIWGLFDPFSAVTERSPRELPGDASFSVWPNPFRDRVCLTVRNRTGSRPAELRIFDVTGTLVRKLALPRSAAPGSQTLFWNGTDNHGRILPGGVYIVRLDCGREVERRALLLLR